MEEKSKKLIYNDEDENSDVVTKIIRVLIMLAVFIAGIFFYYFTH